MQDLGFDQASILALTRALSESGFSPKPAAPGEVRAVRGRSEVHIRREGAAFGLAIPVVRLGAGRPFTPALSKYLDERNTARKGPGTFALMGDTIWYSALCDWDFARAAKTAQAMQEAVEKTGPKILNMLR